MSENHQDKAESKLTAVEGNSQLLSFSPEDEKKARKELARLQKNESRTFKAPHKRTGFEDKTLWDKLNLFGTLAIPLIIALATIGFGLLQLHLADVQHQQDQQGAILQHNQDQASALDQQRAAILQTYIDNIQDLLLNHNLLKSKPDDDLAILARARTLTALQGLDPERKGRLLTFLYEAKLIGFAEVTGKIDDPIIDLFNADLSGADLNGADLSGADLSGADLSEAYLNGAYLSGAHLSGATLSGADLSRANLSSALDLTQQQLNLVYTCKSAILPQGLTCHSNL